MMIIGLFIVPISIGLIIKANDFKTSSKQRKIISLLFLLISVLFIFITFLVNKEPFQFEIIDGFDYFIYSLIIFMFTPFLWINLFFHGKFFFDHLRIRKNSKIKDKYRYKYYRDDLNKISPSIVMFTSFFKLDIKKAITSSILKLKLTKNIVEDKGKFKIEDSKKLLDSEEMVLSLLDKKEFDEKKYEEKVLEESINLGYIKKHRGNMFIKLVKLILTIAIPVTLIILSINFDSYVFGNYKTYYKDGNRYVLVEDDIGDIYYGHVDNIDDYYHGYVEELHQEFYDKSLISASKLSDPYIRKAMTMHTLDGIFFIVATMTALIGLYSFIDQLRYINKSYRRTIAGTELLNHAYALKNFLKDFSDIKHRKEEELVLWEYYLVYATALGVNVDINDKLINKYVN